jgi:asparagine synthase (glutamine-hydrolysing)
MLSADKLHVIVFNGEIYNYKILRRELEGEGIRFRTSSDTEVILEMVRRWGAEGLRRLSGMFAVAIWDVAHQRLLLARDATGIKPLYFRAGKNGFFFASEPKALFYRGSSVSHLDWPSLADFFVFGYPTGGRTMFEEVKELAPGTWIEVAGGRIANQGRFWNWKRCEVHRPFDVVLKETETALVQSLEEHLISDVPVGAFLSGGIDSSLIVALTSRCLGVRLDTFNVRFGEQAYDESVYARAVAKQYGTCHNEILISDGDVDFEIVEKVLDQFDQPFGDSSAIPSYLVCNMIRKHVKVALSGDGGDEMFGGYPRFRHCDTAALIGRVPRCLLSCVDGALSTGSGKFLPSVTRGARRLLRAAAARGGDRLTALGCYVYPDQLDEVLLPEVMSKLHGYRPAYSTGDDIPANAGGRELIDATVVTALPGDYLRKVDVTSGACGLEVRVPFLGRQVLSLAESLPHEFRFNRGRSKILLREIAASYLPTAVARKAKAGFGIPLDSWLGPEGRARLGELLRDSPVRHLVRTDWVDSMVRQFVGGRRDDVRWSRFFVYQQIYFLWGLDRWLRRWSPKIA